MAARRVGTGAGKGGARAAATACALLGVAAMLPGCYAPQIALLRSGLDSLRTQVNTMNVRDSVTYAVLSDTRRELTEQRDILLSTRATSGNTTQELFDQMGRLNNKLDDVLGRFEQVSQRTAPTAAAPTQGDPNQLYDQAQQDLTQGRYGLALQGFRDFIRRFPTSELADNAQYGIGESFFAQSQFDSAAVEYNRVGSQWPKSDKIPASMYKEALSQEKLSAKATSRKLLEDLIKRYPDSGEAQLAREKLGVRDRR
jgi:tol-pal system protein YbgF